MCLPHGGKARTAHPAPIRMSFVCWKRNSIVAEGKLSRPPFQLPPENLAVLLAQLPDIPVYPGSPRTYPSATTLAARPDLSVGRPPLRPDVATPGRSRCPFSAAQARGLRDQSSRPGPERVAAGRHRMPWAHPSGARLRRFSPHCRPRPSPREIKLPFYSPEERIVACGI
jgi:hypothetical protein